jgi:hypothetical protein
MIEPLNLATLPVEHLLRNLPLGEIAAEQCLKFDHKWRKLGPSLAIRSATYNQLGPAWTDTADWRGYLPHGS